MSRYMSVKALLNMIDKTDLYKYFEENGIIYPDDLLMLENGKVKIIEREDGLSEIQINIPLAEWV